MAVISLKSLPLGYRFRPTDEELIDYYLRKKINGNEEDVRVIREVDVCKWEPFELPELSVIETNDKEWFFFCPRDQKYPNGLRLNRATAKGYWKATGKDRKIKSRKFVIGMKKTLVFYRGRAPKGKRTNWVMHEYRTTLEELDGTHPGQGAYVLCRLFEKHDEKIEVSQCDEVEPDVSSPTTPKSSFEDMQSELAQGTPVSGRQTEKQPANSESCQDEDFYRATPDTLVPAECQSNRYNTYDADDQLAEVTATENPPLEEDMDLFCGSILEPEDCKVFSPFHSQVRAELGSCYDPVTNYFGNCHNGLQFQCGTNENDAYISEFLASVLNDSDENCCEELGSQKNLALESETPKYVTPVSQNLASVKDGGSCSESDPEVTQAQLNPELLCCEQSQAAKVSLWVGDELQMDTNPTCELQMDTTPRCYRTLNSDNNNDGNWSTSGFFQTGSPSLDALSAGFAGYQFNDLSVKESSSRTNAVRSDDNMGAGIRIRSRLPNNRPGTQNIINQGTASRRIRLQSRLEVKPLISCKMSKLSFGEEDDEAKSTVTEERNVMEKDTTGIAYATTVDKPLKILLPESNQEVTMNMSPQLRSRSNVPKGGVEIISSVFSKTPPASHSVLSSACILRVTVLMVLFIIFLSLCRCL